MKISFVEKPKAPVNFQVGDVIKFDNETRLVTYANQKYATIDLTDGRQGVVESTLDALRESYAGYEDLKVYKIAELLLEEK